MGDAVSATKHRTVLVLCASCQWRDTVKVGARFHHRCPDPLFEIVGVTDVGP